MVGDSEQRYPIELKNVNKFSAFACVSIGRKPDHQITISATLKREPEAWLLELSPGFCKYEESRRFKLAVKRLCRLDAAIEYAIRNGQSVQRIVESQVRRINGPHRATEQILPLLLPLKVEDKLYAYQRQGVAWLIRHNQALLADDMGLGKTAQAIAGARRLIRIGSVEWSLVVAPRTLIVNWLTEINQWAPELSIATALFRGSTRDDQWRRLIRRAHIVLTSYEQFRQPPKSLLCNPPDLLIADEAHRLRKLDSQCTLGFRKLEKKRIWALTGTPLERDSEDLAVLLSLLNPAQFSPDDKNLHPTSLRARLRPYFLRRRKDDVLEDLPEVIEKVEKLDLTEKQKIAYNATIKKYAESDNHENDFLPHFNQLRFLCDLDSQSGESSKLDRILEALTKIAELGEKTVVFSYTIEPLRCLARRLDVGLPTVRYTFLTGSMSLAERQKSIYTFKSSSACMVLLASTKIASEGLTLTEANHVIFINRWWNPSTNAQARDRVVRIGQSRTVYVKSFTCRGTVEERLEQLLESKSRSFDELIEALSQSTNVRRDMMMKLPE